MSEVTNTSVEAEASAVMFRALCSIASGHVADADAAKSAEVALKEMLRIRREGAPLHAIPVGDREHGEHMGQPPGVLYTLTITDEGDVNEWRSDRVRTPEQVAWLHEQVMAAAEHLAGTSGASGAGVN